MNRKLSTGCLILGFGGLTLLGCDGGETGDASGPGAGGSGAGASAGPGSGPGGSGGPCTSDAACADDALFCNGVPACVDGECTSTPVDCGEVPAGCAAIACSEEAAACVATAIDADGDAHGAPGCADADIPDDDCDETDAAVYPGSWDGPSGDGHESACDQVDQDCNGTADDGKSSVGATCTCTPGDEKDCGTDVGSCEFGTETCGPDGTWGACVGGVIPQPADTCAPGNDDTCDGDANEGCTCNTGEVQNNCGPCGNGTRTCDANGNWGACSGGTPQNQACGPCSDGNSVCGGACQGGTTNYGAACGSCNGTVTCGGGCSVATPGNFGQSCGPCGNGTWGCGGNCNGGTQPGCPAGWADIGGNMCRKTVDFNFEFSDYWYPVGGQMAGCGAGACIEFGDSKGAGVVTDLHLSYGGGGCYHNFDNAMQFQCEGATITLNNAGTGTPSVNDAFYDGQGLGGWCNIFKSGNWTPFAQGSCHKHVSLHMYADIGKGCY